MKDEKKYYSIREVSLMLNIKEHIIRHWDSIDPKTNKLRIDNLSLRTKGGTRFFSKSHIKKISNLLESNNKKKFNANNDSKIISINKDKNFIPDSIKIIQDYEKITEIKNNLKYLINYK